MNRPSILDCSPTATCNGANNATAGIPAPHLLPWWTLETAHWSSIHPATSSYHFGPCTSQQDPAQLILHNWSWGLPTALQIFFISPATICRDVITNPYGLGKNSRGGKTYFAHSSQYPTKIFDTMCAVAIALSYKQVRWIILKLEAQHSPSDCDI